MPMAGEQYPGDIAKPSAWRVIPPIIWRWQVAVVLLVVSGVLAWIPWQEVSVLWVVTTFVLFGIVMVGPAVLATVSEMRRR